VARAPRPHLVGLSSLAVGKNHVGTDALVRPGRAQLGGGSVAWAHPRQIREVFHVEHSQNGKLLMQCGLEESAALQGALGHAYESRLDKSPNCAG